MTCRNKQHSFPWANTSFFVNYRGLALLENFIQGQINPCVLTGNSIPGFHFLCPKKEHKKELDAANSKIAVLQQDLAQMRWDWMPNWVLYDPSYQNEKMKQLKKGSLLFLSPSFFISILEYQTTYFHSKRALLSGTCFVVTNLYTHTGAKSALFNRVPV